jgi:2-keto-4-pentenoate hydratase/2-oxohepta-3-ene-1,7-dioic acid hydratase in catechol pathway
MFQLATFDAGDGPVMGLYRQGDFYPSMTYKDMMEVMAHWDEAEAKLSSAAARMSERQPVRGAKLLAPMQRPPNLYFAGANYHDHMAEMAKVMGIKAPPPGTPGMEPWFLLKSTSTIVGPGAVVTRPAGVQRLDWEVELAVIMGRACRSCSVQDALEHVAGYTIANDVSARDRMKRTYEDITAPFVWDWLQHKSFAGACPMGPAITPAVYVPDVQKLGLKLWVNDVLMQDSNTAQMVYSVAELISNLSHKVPLVPGDVILTGTPAGVGTSKQIFLQPGDRVRQSIDLIGEFEFTIA